MQSHLLDEALKVITSPQILVNVISRRVKQLTAGHRPLVEMDSPRAGFADIALTEVIKLKLTYEMVAVVVPEPVVPVAFSARKLAA
jgi:DNA-directed RNA polymerase subunit omega